MDELYDLLHKNESTPVKVGVDMSALVAACAAAERMPRRGLTADMRTDAVEIGLTSWKLYWDDATSKYAFFHPVVALPDGSTITATGATGISAFADYYCDVRKSSAGVYTATVVTASAASPTTVMMIPLCSIGANGVDQYHTGVIQVVQTETATSLPRPFDIVDDTENPGTRRIVNCKIPCPITVYTAADYTINGTNDAYLHVDYSNAQYVLTVDQVSRPNSSTHAQFKLYEFSEQTGAVTLDLRPTALPLFAL